MKERDRQQPTDEWPAPRPEDAGAASAAVARLYKLARRIERLEEDVTNIADDLSALIEDIFRGCAGASAARAAGKAQGTNRTAAYWQDVLRGLARSGVGRVKVAREEDGSAHAAIGPLADVSLPPALADFLEILCADTGTSGDACVGWKPWDDIAILLGKKPNKAGRHAVANLAYRLKALLAEHGGNPFWIQSDRRRGFRFLLHREKGLVTGPPPRDLIAADSPEDPETRIESEDRRA